MEWLARGDRTGGIFSHETDAYTMQRGVHAEMNNHIVTAKGSAVSRHLHWARGLQRH